MSRYPYIAREGWPLIAIAGMLALASLIVEQWLVLLSAVFLFFFLMFIFRDPERGVPSSPLAIVSPTDGVVTSIEEMYDGFLKRKALQIHIHRDWYGIRTTRSPVEGKVAESWHSAEDEAHDQRHGIWIQTDEDDSVILVMHGKGLFQSPRCYVNYGERLGQGQRCGSIGVGTDVELLINVNSKVAVQVGDTVKAGSDIIATMIH